MTEDPQGSTPPATDSAPASDQDGTPAGPPQPPAAVPASGRRQSLRELRRELSEEDLTPAVAKVLLDDLFYAEARCEELAGELAGYIERYHDADKRAAVLEERLESRDRVDEVKRKGRVAIDVVYGTGLGITGILASMVPMIWDKQPQAILLIAVAVVVGVGSVAVKALKG